MAQTRKNGQICILFSEVPEGTFYRAGAYSWVNKKPALEYIDKGYAVEYDPEETQEKQFYDKKPTEANTVKQIKAWMDRVGVEYSDENKSELLELVENTTY